jgi:hypothetical protein
MMHHTELKDPPLLDVRRGRVDQWTGSLPGRMHLVEASVDLGVHVKVQSLPFNVTLVSPFVLLLQALLQANVSHSCRTHRVK